MVKNELLNLFNASRVWRIDVTHASAQNDDVRIYDIDDGGNGHAKVRDEAINGRCGMGILAILSPLRYFCQRPLLA